MVKKIADGRELVRGAASRKDRCFIISKLKEAQKQGYAHTSVISVQAGKLHACVDTEWDSTAIAVAELPARKVVLVGEDGDVTIYLGDKKSVEETLTPTPKSIRNAKAIGGYVFACGMKRQVYKRTDEMRWQDVSAPAPRGSDATGFEAIDGYSDREVYAVGWKGEIWQYDGVKWYDRSIPTNLVLSSICCTPKGAYAAGQKGVLVKGRADAWTIVEFDDPVDADIWDLCWFKDRLYLATMSGLLTLEGDALTEVDTGEVEISTFNSLSVAEDVLWSVGQHDVASFDGKKWQIY